MPGVSHPLEAASLTGHDAFVEGVEFSSNGKYIMSSSSGELEESCFKRRFCYIFLLVKVKLISSLKPESIECENFV